MSRLAPLLILLFGVYQAHAESTPAEAQKFPFGYMTSAINRTTALLSKSPLPDRSTLIEASSEACAALTRLLSDERFYQGLDKIQGNSSSTKPTREVWATNATEFRLAFVVNEEKAFKQAGLDEPTTKALVQALNDFQAAVDDDLDVKKVIHATEHLRDQFCTSRDRLHNAHTAEDETKRLAQEAEVRRRHLWGIGLVVADTGAEILGIIFGGPVGAGVIAPIAVASVSVGMTYISANPAPNPSMTSLP